MNMFKEKLFAVFPSLLLSFCCQIVEIRSVSSGCMGLACWTDMDILKQLWGSVLGLDGSSGLVQWKVHIVVLLDWYVGS